MIFSRLAPILFAISSVATAQKISGGEQTPAVPGSLIASLTSGPVIAPGATANVRFVNVPDNSNDLPTLVNCQAIAKSGKLTTITACTSPSAPVPLGDFKKQGSAVKMVIPADWRSQSVKFHVFVSAGVPSGGSLNANETVSFMTSA